jgi:signal transduction histidine kinase
MLRQFFNWRSALALAAIAIVIGTIFYSRYLGNKIERDERQKVELWIEAGRFIFNSPADADTRLASSIITHNTDIPIIETNDRDSITAFINLDSTKISSHAGYLRNQLNDFKSQHEAIPYQDPGSGRKNFYYYGDSRLLQEVRYYPLVQLLIVALFISIILYAITLNNRATQNQVWAGMAKETAHQLGTPLTSLEAWVEMMKEQKTNEKIVGEMEKDVSRLKLVSDRFSKIGSTPQLEEANVVQQIGQMVEYIRKRAPGRVNFSVHSNGQTLIIARISAPLFDWVVENLLKNALDAMEGKGDIRIDIMETSQLINIDVSDTGKGISPANISRVFKPGFTTKKRGWGLGLSLSKRIIEQYHRGHLYVKNSELGRGTTFRMVLKKEA